MRSSDDFLERLDVFPGVGLREAFATSCGTATIGPCHVTTHFKDWPVSTTSRPLLEKGADVFIRFNEGLSILKKVIAVETGNAESLSLPEGKNFEGLVSSRNHLGRLPHSRARLQSVPAALVVLQNGGIGYVFSKALFRPDVHRHRQVEGLHGLRGPREPAIKTLPTQVHQYAIRCGTPARISSDTYLVHRPFRLKARKLTSVLSYLYLSAYSLADSPT